MHANQPPPDTDVAGTRAPDSADQECTTLYVGNLAPVVNVSALQGICTYLGPVEQVKVIKDKTTGASAGYGFVKFVDRRSAEAALAYLQHKVLYGQELRVNWAFPSHQREDTSNHFYIFVGDLSQEVSDSVLYNAFSALEGCSDARVMWDHITGRSKGYGFVSFRTRPEAQSAIDKMHGHVVGARRVRCGWAQHKQEEGCGPMDRSALTRSDPTNTNMYVGNIAPEWLEADIQAHFAQFGKILEVKSHKKGGYCFVRFERHTDAVEAIVQTHGQTVMGRVLKCSWGKSGPSPGGAAAAAAAAAMAAAAPGSNMFGGGAVPALLLPSMQPQLAGMMGGMGPPGMMTSQMLMPAQLQGGGGHTHMGAQQHMTPQQYMVAQQQAMQRGQAAQMMMMGSQQMANMMSRQMPQMGGRMGAPVAGLDPRSMAYFASPGMYYPQQQ